LSSTTATSPVRILKFNHGAHGAIRAICRLWEPSEDRMGRRHGNKYHLYADNIWEKEEEEKEILEI